MGRDRYCVLTLSLVLSDKQKYVEEKKAFFALFALRFPALAEYLKESFEPRDASYLRAELEIGSYEIGDKEIEVTVTATPTILCAIYPRAALFNCSTTVKTLNLLTWRSRQAMGKLRSTNVMNGQCMK
jgi:hypothetical protein